MAPLLGVDRQARHAEGLEVAARRPFRDLQLFGDLGRRHLAAGLQEQEDGDETVGPHGRIFPKKPARA